MWLFVTIASVLLCLGFGTGAMLGRIRLEQRIDELSKKVEYLWAKDIDKGDWL